MRAHPSITARRLLGHLISEGPTHRAELSRALDVSRTTISNLAAALIEDGTLVTLEREAPAATPPDRPPLKQQLGVSPQRGVLVSAVFRMTSTTLVVGSLDGRLLRTAGQECRRDEPGRERMERAQTLLSGLLAECGLEESQILRVHLAVNTQCDRESGEILSEQGAGAWRGVNPKREASRWSSAPVLIENAARLISLAEYHALSAPRPRSLVYVHLSWGITMGQVVDGTINPGSHGGAGELGHVSIDPMGPPCGCGNRGCLMLYTGLDAITERLQVALGADADVADAVEAMAHGSHACSTIFADAGETVGRALAMVCNIMDPDAVVLGGELAAAGPEFAEAVRASLQRRALPLVTRTLELSLATTSGDLDAAGIAALRAMRTQAVLVEELASSALDG
ncbi:hypothetical protein CFK39_10780 [Brachybacterium avium]|uniref:Transcriptional regulator n=1 Tax=Brachybacterium avium TaxID=2017485 RepID=A0A220UE49_9MICO|nr:ROK family transcriptional regulator [Brachybacterium avium]ASK66221.1 hypothetical protein CFK39_10780 [Brachybacterium avium]